MLDAKYIRDEFDEIKKNLKMRKDDEVISRLDSWKEKDEEWRAIKLELEELKKQRNDITQKIKMAKGKGEDASKLLEKAKEIPAKIKEDEPKVKQLKEELHTIQMRIPNVLHASVPYGKDDSENVEDKKWGDVEVNKDLFTTHNLQLTLELLNLNAQ